MNKIIGYCQELMPNGMIAKSWTRSRGDWMLITAIVIALFEMITGFVIFEQLLSSVQAKIFTPEQMKMMLAGIGTFDITIITLFLTSGWGGKLIQKKMETSSLDGNTPTDTPGQ